MYPSKLIDIDLSQPIDDRTDLAGFAQVRGLVRWRRRPLGWVEIPVRQGICRRSDIADRVLPYFTWLAERELVHDYLLQPGSKTWQLPDLFAMTPALHQSQPLITVAYCLGDRPVGDDCLTQLRAIAALDYPQLEILVVEALPVDPQLAQLIAQQFPQFRYHSVLEAGLNAARNWAIDQAQGTYVAFLDRVTHPEPDWAIAIAQAFAENPQVAAITGLTIPHALPDRVTAQFAQHYALERGFEPRYFQWRWSLSDRRSSAPHWSDLGTGQIGSGANLAVRRSAQSQIGPFDPALDLPGRTEGGGDLDWFARALGSGATLLYEPRIVAHWHVPTTEAAQRQYSQQRFRGFYSALQSGLARYPQCQWQWLTLGGWRSALSLMRLVRTYGIPRSWSWAELQAGLTSWGRYAAGLRYIAALPPNPTAMATNPLTKHMAVRTIDLNQPLSAIADITDYAHVRLFLQQDRHIGAKVDRPHHGIPVSADQLARTIAEQRLWPLLAQAYDGDIPRTQREVEQALQTHWLPPLPPTAIDEPVTPATPPIPIPDRISIIIPTGDRPDDLISCLTHLCQQQSDRTIEIIVADNRPRSGITAPIVAQFPGVIYLPEARAGSSYARNAAIAASHGEVIVMVDDDVVVPSDWLEKLLAPLARPEVMAVTGNLLPFELETEAQWVFEDLKGGLGQGWKRIEADRAWLDSFEHSPPTWELGVSANAAFRASLFADPQVGLMEEVLGAGTPCCGGEENHLVYKVLRAGHTLVYEPKAYAWHRHRKTMQALSRQWHGYMRSGAGYHLILWLQEGDRRALKQLFSVLPKHLLSYVADRLMGKHQVPWSVVRGEVTGYLAGFWGYYQSCQRVKRLGRSAPYVPPEQRSHTGETAPDRWSTTDQRSSFTESR